MPIRRLPPLLVNQIAAGEVIERPASVVKELVENAIDAGAKRIEIAIEEGGCERIRISDDGCGIPAEELPLAIAPHATSKIVAAEDLDAIATMGFRGEALASIASVSRLSLQSRPRSQSAASIVTVEGDSVQPVQPAAGACGTTVTVRNLFFNTPARRKFLKSAQTEASRVEDVIESLALAHPSIAFLYSCDGRVRLDAPAATSAHSRALEILGRELESELLEVRREDGSVAVMGWAGKPAIARGTSKHQHLYLNGRPIHDRSIQHAIKEAYRGLIDPTRWPTIVLFLTIEPAQVDVNVHPAKAEVRFRNQASVHGAVMSAIREALRAADLAPILQNAFSPRSGGQWTGAGDEGAGSAGPAMQTWSASLRAGEAPSLRPEHAHPPFSSGLPAAENATGARSHAGAFVEYFRRLDPVQRGFVYSEVKQALDEDRAERATEQFFAGDDDAGDSHARLLPAVKPIAEAMQVHSSYIVTHDEQGLIIIDQHALHERVMFEKLKGRIANGELESQRLLLPAVVAVDRAHIALLDDLKPLLARIGIDAQAIGPASIAVHSFTTLLFERGVDPAQFMLELLESAAQHGLQHDDEAALHRVLDMMACKAAVKAGDRLQPEELAELLKCRAVIERASNCPHGRPTSLRLTLKELEKQFGRR